MLPDADDVRASILAEVQARRPVDARERWSIRQFATSFDGLTSPFDEHANPVHVTSSAIVVSDDGRSVVLHRHRRLKIWLQPGGHIDAGEHPADAALREAVEETGLPARSAGTGIIHVDVHPGPRKHTHLDLRYLVHSPAVAPQPPEGESQDVSWFRWHEAVAMAEPGLEGVLRALQPGVPKVRRARHNDAPDCARVFARSRRFALGALADGLDDAEIRRWMSDDVVGRADAWVAELDGTVVGMMVLDGDRGGGWIEHLYLDPAWIGRGLGEQFVDIARGRHPAGLQLWTFQANEPARRFYERLGFRAVEHTDGAGNTERAPDVRYQWEPHG